MSSRVLAFELRPAISSHEPGAPAESEDLHELLTVKEVAVMLKVPTSWVYEHTRSRGMPESERLPYIKLGKYVRFDPQALRTFLEERSKPA